MNETAVPSSGHYGGYLKIWIVLLVLTILMLFIDSRSFLIAGMTIKGTLIAGWFMHLKSERFDFVFYVVFSMVFFSLLLFGLIAPDGWAM